MTPKYNSTNSFPRSPRSGLTLIEVTAGIVLLSTLLVASIVAFHGHARQIKKANRTAAAVHAADKLLSNWFAAAVRVPLQAGGLVPADDSLAWQTAVIGSGQNDVLAWQIVRLQISDTQSADAPLAEVDVVVPGGWPSEAVP